MSIVVHKLLDWLRKELASLIGTNAAAEAHHAFVIIADEVLTRDDVVALASKFNLVLVAGTRARDDELRAVGLCRDERGAVVVQPRRTPEEREAYEASERLRVQMEKNAEDTRAAMRANPHLFPHLIR